MVNLEQRKFIEPRWPIVITILIALILIRMLPERISVFPIWLVYSYLTVMIICTFAVPLSKGKLIWRTTEKRVMLLFCILSELANLISLGYLIREMIIRSKDLSGLELLTSSVSIWIINVLAFSLVYWQLDRGGPEARHNNNSLIPEWLFPQDSISEYKQWKPVFVDYLFLSYTSATAFSPTDVLPLSSRSKLLMMLESTISLVTIVVVASRAINILGG